MARCTTRKNGEVSLTNGNIHDGDLPRMTSGNPSKTRRGSSSGHDENNNSNNRNRSKKDLICFICQKQFKNPKLLPCLHTFCRQCLGGCVERHRGVFRVKCPLCFAVKQITSKSVDRDECLDDLVSDFVALNMLDSVAVDALSREGGTCGSCSEYARGVSRCSECDLVLCSECQRTHKRTRMTRNHNVSSLALLNILTGDSSHRANYCATHTGEILTYYCKTCDRPVCNDCTFIDHPKLNHDLVPLSDVTSSQRRRLAELLARVRRNLPFLKRTLQDIDVVLWALPDHADAVVREIARNTENFIQLLHQRQSQLLDELTHLCVNKAQVLHEQRSRIESELDILESNCRTTEEILRNGSDSEISSVNSLLCDRLQSLKNMTLDIEPDETAEFGYESDVTVLSEAILKNGRLYLTPPGAPLKVMGDGLHDAAVGKVASFMLAKSKHCELSPGDIDVRIETPDSVFLSCDVKQDSALYNVFYNPRVPGEHEISVTVLGQHLPDSPICVNVKQGHMTYAKKHVRWLTFGQRGNSSGCFDQVCDVAVRNNGHIVAADSFNHRVQVFTSKGNFISQFGSKGKGLGRLLFPAGLAISPEGHVIVTEHGNHRVQVFTSDGIFLWSFGGHGNTEGLMDHPTGVAVDEEGHIVVVDQHNHRVQVFDRDGCFHHQFGCYGVKDGEFDRPMYVAISHDGEIIVTDSGNHRIQVFGEDGRFRRAVGRPGTNNGEFYYPTGITIDASGHAIVCDKSNRIQMFDHELEFEAKLDTRDRGVGKVDCPMGVDYTPEGKIAVAVTGNNSVKILYT